jgi:hypothetical protein
MSAICPRFRRLDRRVFLRCGQRTSQFHIPGLNDSEFLKGIHKISPIRPLAPRSERGVEVRQ